MHVNRKELEHRPTAQIPAKIIGEQYAKISAALMPYIMAHYVRVVGIEHIVKHNNDKKLQRFNCTNNHDWVMYIAF